jgi:hypothetical protein
MQSVLPSRFIFHLSFLRNEVLGILCDVDADEI